MQFMRFAIAASLAGATLAVANLSEASAKSAKPDCQTMAMQNADGSPRDVLMCKDANGRWYEAGQAAAPAPVASALPAKSRVTYQGTYEITVTKPGRAMRKISLDSLLKAAGDSKKMEGAVTYNLTIDGQSITGTITTTTGGRGTGITGIIQNGNCRIYTADGTEVHEGRCDANGFSGKASSTGKGKDIVKGTFQASTVTLVDVGAEQAQQAQATAQANAEKDAEKQRMEDLLKSLPTGKGNQ